MDVGGVLISTHKHKAICFFLELPNVLVLYFMTYMHVYVNCLDVRISDTSPTCVSAQLATTYTCTCTCIKSLVGLNFSSKKTLSMSVIHLLLY